MKLAASRGIAGAEDISDKTDFMELEMEKTNVIKKIPKCTTVYNKSVVRSMACVPRPSPVNAARA